MAFTDYGLSSFAKTFFRKAKTERDENLAFTSKSFDDNIFRENAFPWEQSSFHNPMIETFGPEEKQEPRKTLPDVKIRKGIESYLGEAPHVVRQRAMVEYIKHLPKPKLQSKSKPAVVEKKSSVLPMSPEGRAMRDMTERRRRESTTAKTDDTTGTRASWGYDKTHASLDAAIDAEMASKPIQYGIHLGVLPVPNLWAQAVELHGGAVPWVGRNIDARPAKEVLISKGLRPPSSYQQLVRVPTIGEEESMVVMEGLFDSDSGKKKKKKKKHEKVEKRNEYNTPSDFERWVVKRRAPTHYFSKVDRLKSLHHHNSPSPGPGHYYPFNLDVAYACGNKADFHKIRTDSRVRAEKSGTNLDRMF